MAFEMKFYEFDPFSTYLYLKPTFKQQILAGDLEELAVHLFLKQKEFLKKEELKEAPGKKGRGEPLALMTQRIREWLNIKAEIKMPLWAVIALCEYHDIDLEEIKANTIFWSGINPGGQMEAVKIEPYDLELDENMAYLFGLLSNSFSILLKQQIVISIDRRKSSKFDEYFSWLAESIYAYCCRCFGNIGPSFKFIYGEVNFRYSIYLPVGISRNVIRFLKTKLRVKAEEIKDGMFLSRKLYKEFTRAHVSNLEKIRSAQTI